MQTRRDRLQAYQFLVKRIRSSLLGAKPEAPEQPMRRVQAAMFSGVMVAALACGGVALYGFVSHIPSRDWKTERVALVQDRETGGHFLYFADSTGEKKLYPVTNYLSAQLILPEGFRVRIMPAVNTDGVPRGPQVGLENVPNSLPAAANLLQRPWSVCDHREESQAVSTLSMMVGDIPAGAAGLAPHTLIVEAPAGRLYLIWAGKRLRITEDGLAQLNLSDAPRVRVRPGWLSLLLEGTAIRPLAIPGSGLPARQVKGASTVVGQVFVTNLDKYFLMRAAGLVPISQTQAYLQLNSGVARAPGGRQESFTKIQTADMTAARALGARNPTPPDHPAELPEPLDLPNEILRPALCVVYDDTERERLQVRVVDRIAETEWLELAGRSSLGDRADRISLPGGKFAIVQALSGANTQRRTLYVIADNGLKYPVPDIKVLREKLGYAEVKPVPLPNAFADLLRTGPVLDPVAARGDALRDVEIRTPTPGS